MATIFISEEELEDFIAEQPTEPMLLMTDARSTVDGFLATARVVRPASWVHRLDLTLDGVDVNDVTGVRLSGVPEYVDG